MGARGSGWERDLAMSALISFWLYITPPRVSAASAIVLVRRLINAAPADLTEDERDALRHMREQAVTVQDIEKTRERLRPENLKEEDRFFDGYWGVLKDQIFAWLRVDVQARMLLSRPVWRLIGLKTAGAPRSRPDRSTCDGWSRAVPVGCAMRSSWGGLS